MKEHETLNEELDLEALLEAERALHQTMVFSEADMKKLRQPNLQPEDSDYFDQVTLDAVGSEVEQQVEQVSPPTEKENGSFDIERTMGSQQNIEVPLLVDKKEQVDPLLVEQQTSAKKIEVNHLHTVQMAVQDTAENNEFTYHSKVKRPIETEEIPVESKSKWNILELLTSHYDIDALEPLEVYNQFEHENSEDLEVIAHDAEPTFWRNIGAKIGQLFSKNNSEAVVEEHSTKDEISKSTHKMKSLIAKAVPTVHEETKVSETTMGTKNVEVPTMLTESVEVKTSNVLESADSGDTVVFEVNEQKNQQSEEAIPPTSVVEKVAVSETTAGDNQSSQVELDKSDVEKKGNEIAEMTDSTVTESDEVEFKPHIKEELVLSDESKTVEEQRLKGEISPEFADRLDLTETKVLSTEAIQAYEQLLSKKSATFQESILTDHTFEDYLVDDDLTVSDELSEELNDKQNIVRGAAWLTFGNIFSRILGAIYVLPWAAWLGAEYLKANSLFSIGYTIYAFFLAVATAGFPSAIAKQIAFYHSRKEYKTADKLFKVSMGIMVGTGIVAAALLYIVAPFYVSYTATNNPTAAIIVVRSLVPALLILPMMSLLRGYFQGFNDMMPTAVSQVLEQIARVVYMLGATYAIMELYNGQAADAVVHSTFAAFVGGMISLLYLIIIYLRQLPKVTALIRNDQHSQDFEMAKIVKIMVLDSIPFIVLGSGIIVAQLIDTLTFSSIIHFATTYTNNEIEELFGVLSLDVNKLIMIIISLAIGISLSSIPAISRKFAEGDKKGTGELIEHICLLFTCVMMPASLGMASIAKMVYQLFYANGSQHGPALLVSSSYLSIVLGLYTVLSTILQSMNYRRKSMQYLLIGLIVKFAAQFPLMYFLHTQGAVYSTLIGFLVTSILMWRQIHRDVRIGYVDFLPKLGLLVLGSIVMSIATYFWGKALDGLFGDVGRLMTFGKVFGVVVLGVLVYGAILAVTGLLSLLIGNRHRELQDKLRLF